MPVDTSVSRRDSFKAALLPLAATAAGASAGAPRAHADGRNLVAYLSRSGNTRVLAGALSRRFGADLSRSAPARSLARRL